MVATFRETESVADAHKGQDHSSFGMITENIQNLQECHEDQDTIFQKKLAFQEHQF